MEYDYIKCGDCLELMKDIPDGSIDLVLTDPPYGITDCEWDIVIPFDLMWDQLRRVCKSNGVVVLFGNEPFSSKMRHSNLRNYRYDWVWEKENGSSGLNSGNMPIRIHENISVFYASDLMYDTTNFFGKSKEYLISEKQKAEKAGYHMAKVLGNCMDSHYFTRKTQFQFPTKQNYEKLQQTGFFRRHYDEVKKEYDEEKRDYDAVKKEYDDAKKVTYNPQMGTGKPRSGGVKTGAEVFGKKKCVAKENFGTRYPKSILKFNREFGFHPTQKPIALLEYLIKTYTNTGDTVLDFTMGSGSTCVAAVNTNRHYIGFELEPKYFEIAAQRLEDAKKNKRKNERG